MSIGLHRSLGRRAFRKTSATRAIPCTAEQLRALVEYERLRTDRNGSPFTLVLMTLLHSENPAEDGAELASLLDHRLRLTDEIGWWDVKTIGILLTDTGPSGARPVVDDLLRLVAGRISTACRISVYPSNDDEPGNPSNTYDDENGVATVGNDSQEGPPIRQLLARPMPFWKRAMDVLGAIAGLTLLAPILLLVAVLVKLTSRGPVFFRQERVGWGGRRFKILKFRTMHVDAEQRKAELFDLNEQDGPAFKLRNDPRLTWLGRYLRRSCIDELPQMWHVLLGEMSLVGPRPMDSAEAKFCESWQRRRYVVTPGLTCTWQVHGKSKVSFNDWMRMDLRYIESRSPWEDVKLIFATVIAVILHRASH